MKRDIDLVLSTNAAFGEKNAAWMRLKEAGQLDDAIAEFKRRFQEEPQRADFPAGIGKAYLLKAGSVQDVREQGINGLTADRSFDQALAVDPKNWDAQYWKAFGMTFWPAEMNKGTEIQQRLTDLIHQQETMPVQPQFAQSYLLLGDQYVKAGYTDEARQILERGQAFFPSETKFRAKLAQIAGN